MFGTPVTIKEKRLKLKWAALLDVELSVNSLRMLSEI